MRIPYLYTVFAALNLHFTAAAPESGLPSNSSVPELRKRTNGDLCRMRFQRGAVVVGDRLWWMGGGYTFDGGAKMVNLQTLFSLDLSTEFATDGFLSNTTLQRTDMPQDVPWQTQGALFYDNTTLYLFAGTSDEMPATQAMWNYNVSSNKWNRPNAAGGMFNFNNREDGWYTSDPASGQSFFLGGQEGGINGVYASRHVPGMVKFDASNPALLSWKNETQQSDSRRSLATPSSISGSMVFVRMGRKGVLIGFGGYDSSRTVTTGAAWSGYAFRPMDQISVYDIYSSTWHSINATGDIPPEMTNFCAGVSAAPDDSSFQIHMYGGYNILYGTTYSDVYILSVPAFQWIKVSTGTHVALADIPRMPQFCPMWQERTMFAVGGNGGNDCDPSVPVMRVLDTTDLEWQSSFNPNKSAQAYEVPEAVYSVIGGDASGKAVKRQPSGGWANGDLFGIFSQTVPRIKAPSLAHTSNTTQSSDSDGSTASSAMPSATSPSASQPVKFSAGVIAGAVIAPLAGFAIAFGLLYVFFIRKRSMSRLPDEPRSSWIKPELASKEIYIQPVSEIRMPPPVELAGPAVDHTWYAEMSA